MGNTAPHCASKLCAGDMEQKAELPAHIHQVSAYPRSGLQAKAAHRPSSQRSTSPCASRKSFAVHDRSCPNSPTHFSAEASPRSSPRNHSSGRHGKKNELPQDYSPSPAISPRKTNKTTRHKRRVSEPPSCPNQGSPQRKRSGRSATRHSRNESTSASPCGSPEPASPSRSKPASKQHSSTSSPRDNFSPACHSWPMTKISLSGLLESLDDVEPAPNRDQSLDIDQLERRPTPYLESLDDVEPAPNRDQSLDIDQLERRPTPYYWREYLDLDAEIGTEAKISTMHCLGKP